MSQAWIDWLESHPFRKDKPVEEFLQYEVGAARRGAVPCGGAGRHSRPLPPSLSSTLHITLRYRSFIDFHPSLPLSLPRSLAPPPPSLHAPLLASVAQVPPGAPTWTMADVARGKGTGTDGRSIYYVLNDKVIEYVGPREGGVFDDFIQPRAGTDCTLDRARRMYDPRYGLPATLADMSAEHKAAVGDG